MWSNKSVLLHTVHQNITTNLPPDRIMGHDTNVNELSERLCAQAQQLNTGELTNCQQCYWGAIRQMLTIIF